LNNLQNAREVVRWAFNDASEGAVSPVFELDNAYVVANLKKKYEEGTATLDQVRQQVLVQVRNDKKAEIIKKDLKEKLHLKKCRLYFQMKLHLTNPLTSNLVLQFFQV
jgi:peptidyl-prolyl cis-trans isomerase D